MIPNYLTVAWRSLLKGGASYIVSIAGLLAGICGTVLIAMFVLDEFKYDQHFLNKQRIFRLTSALQNDGTIYRSAQTDGAIASIVSARFPEVETATRMLPVDEAFLFTDGAAFKEHITYTDSAFLKVFALDMLLGSPDNGLARPSSIIISESAAKRLFGSEWRGLQVLGQTLSIDNKIPLTVTGVFRDLPEHTHFNSHLFATVPAGLGNWMENGTNLYTYVLLHEHSDVDAFDQKLASATDRLSQSYTKGSVLINAQPLTDIHFSDSLEDDNAILANKKNVYGLVLGALVLMIITITNFANVYTANALSRLKEVGIRKAIGAFTRQLRYQFFAETLLITVAAAALAMVAAAGVVPVLNDLSNKNFSAGSLVEWPVLALFTGIILGTAFLSSLYPAMVLSGMRAMQALRGGRAHSVSATGWRKALIVLQFSVSAVTIMLSVVGYRQIKLINDRPLGFDKHHTVTLANPYMLGSTEKIKSLRNELQTISGVERVSVTGYTPSQNRWARHEMTFPGRDAESAQRQIANWIMVDAGFIETMGLTLISGRNFIEESESDRNAIIINEKAVSGFGLSDNGRSPLGAELSFESEDGRVEQYTVIGVVKDFNFGSLHSPIKPMIMKYGLHRFEMVMRLSPAYSSRDVIARAEKVWRRNLPLIPFEYSFIEDRFDQLHESDADAGKLFFALSILAIVISAMGLFSVVAYTIARRTREIGIRKVLGASERSITFLIAKDFVIMIVIAYTISLPVGTFFSDRWLADFAYRVELNSTVYGLVALTLTLVTAATLGIQSMQAASMNPVDTLRYD